MSDILEKMTKEELIKYIRENTIMMIRRPRESEILYNRYHKKFDEHMIESERLTAGGKNIDMKTRDEIAKKFNASTDAGERLRLLDQIKPYEDQWAKHMKKLKANMKAFDELEKEYERIEVIQESERA